MRTRRNPLQVLTMALIGTVMASMCTSTSTSIRLISVHYRGKKEVRHVKLQLHISHNRFKYIEERLEVGPYTKTINCEGTLDNIKHSEYVVDYS